MELTELQKATSDHIIDVFTRVKRYLLADEVGLGKTIIAADVIKRLADEKGSAPFIVYYICGNQRVTAQNKGKLIAYCDGCETEDDRLSMQWCYIKEYIDSKKNIWILPVTPATTFTNAGSEHEKREETNQGIFFKLIKSKYNIDFDYNPKEFIKNRRFIVEHTIKDILKPDMVILDEFQNYPGLLYGDYHLFKTMLDETDYLLMLSATPYQMPTSKVEEMNKAPFKDDTGLKEATKKAGSGTDDEESDTDECAEFSSDSWNLKPNDEFKRLVKFIAGGEISDDQIKDEDFLYNNVLCRSERSQFYKSGSKEAEVIEKFCGFEEVKAHIDYSSTLFRHYTGKGWDKWKKEPNKFIAFVKESPSFAKYSTRYISIRGGESDNKNELTFFKNRLDVFVENADQTQHSGIAMVKKLALNDDSIRDMLWIPPALGVDEYQTNANPFWKNRNYSKTLVFGNYRLSTASCANYFSSAVREYQSQFTYSGEPITEKDLEELLPSDMENKAVKALRNLVVTYFNANMGLICHVTGKTGADAAKEYARMGGLKKVLEEYVFVLGLTADANDEKLNSISKTLGNMTDYFGEKDKFAPTKIICYDTGKKTFFSGEDVEALKNTFSLSCGFAERFTDDDSDRNAHKKSHQMNLQALFNSPFYPFVIASTSVAQEGLDFHNYCHQIVHWSVPKTPIAFEQREGRIDRFLSHLIRKRIAAHSSGEETWVELIDKLKNESNGNPLVPYWYVPVKDSENAAPQFIRAVNVLPFSKEESHYRKLKTALKEYNYYLGPNYQDKDKIDLSPFLKKRRKT